MKATEKGPEGPVTAAAGEKPDFVEAAVHLYTTGIERLAEAQKKAIDLTINHNAEMVNTWKKQAWAAPGFFMLDLATTAFDRYAETQKGMIDLVVEQSHVLAGVVKERKVKAGKIMDDSMAKAQEAIDQVDSRAEDGARVYDQANQGGIRNRQEAIRLCGHARGRGGRLGTARNRSRG